MLFAIVLGLVGTALLLGAFRALVFSYLWAWFVVPLGAPGISIAHAFGIAMIVTLLTNKPDLQERDSAGAAERFGKAMAVGLFGGAFLWGIGFIVHLVAA